jgi:hypothetical protein
LQEGVHGDSTRGLGEEFELVEVFLGFGFALLGSNQTHQDGALLFYVNVIDTFTIVNQSHKVTFFII